MLKHNPHLIKSAYNKLIPYVPGRDADLLANDLGLESVIKLASNENPLGPSPKALEAATQYSAKSHRYPDSHATYLRAKLAERFSISEEKIIVGSGADSLIHALTQTFISATDEAVMSEFAFASYEIATRANEGIPIIVKSDNFGHDLKAMQQAVSEKTKLVFLANPNNPTGTCFDHLALMRFLKAVPKTVLVVLDEAYYEYNHERMDIEALLSQFENLIILRTFSKAYGLAGFRVGYAFADPSIIELLNRIRSPFTVSVTSLAAATAALDDDAFLDRTLKHNKAAMTYFTTELKHLNLNYIPSTGNFVCVAFGEKSNDIFQTLLSKGIILRPLVNYKMSRHLRITLGLEDDLKHLIKKLWECNE